MKLPNTAEGAKEGIGHSCLRLPRILRFGPIDYSVNVTRLYYMKKYQIFELSLDTK